MPCSWRVRNTVVVLAVLLCQHHSVLVSAQPTTLLRANGIAVAPCSSSYTCWTCTTHFINVTQSTRGVTGCGWCASTKTCSTLTADGRAGRSCAVADTVRGGSDQCPRQLGTLPRSTLLQRRWMLLLVTSHYYHAVFPPGPVVFQATEWGISVLVVVAVAGHWRRFRAANRARRKARRTQLVVRAVEKVLQ